MRSTLQLIIATASIWIASCSGGNVIEVHHKAVTEGYHELPIAKPLNARFPAWSFITHFNIPTRGKKKDEKTWNTLTYAYGRYELHFVQEVQLDRSGMKIAKPLDERLRTIVLRARRGVVRVHQNVRVDEVPIAHEARRATSAESI